MNQVMSRFLQWAAIACRDERLEQIFIFLQVDILEFSDFVGLSTKQIRQHVKHNSRLIAKPY